LRSFSGFCAACFSELTKGKLICAELHAFAAKFSQTVETTVKSSSRAHYTGNLTGSSIEARWTTRPNGDEARARLAIRRSTVHNVAESVGFKNRFVFSRAFERRFGLSPNAYRQSFSLRPNRFSEISLPG
jgi:AraC-like DNA-binding protein